MFYLPSIRNSKVTTLSLYGIKKKKKKTIKILYDPLGAHVRHFDLYDRTDRTFFSITWKIYWRRTKVTRKCWKVANNTCVYLFCRPGRFQKLNMLPAKRLIPEILARRNVLFKPTLLARFVLMDCLFTIR